MENNWSRFWKSYLRFIKKAETKESTAATLAAFLFYFAGCGLLLYCFVAPAAWTFITGLLSLIIGGIIFRINTALARCKVDEEENKNHPDG